MKALQAFADIAPHLKYPLVLVGFGLLLIFGIYRVLIRAGVVPAAGRPGGRGVQDVLVRHVFAIALL